ncbi:hypothetical protein Tco_0083269, partial [Tanacetum coccineum]
MMTTEYCPTTEIQRMEQELWTLTLKGDDIETYNNCFHKLALICLDLVTIEKKKVERYIRGFPKRIKGNITSLKPTTLHDAINMACELVEQLVQGRAARVCESNKRKQEAARVYVAAPTDKRNYAGNAPYCNKYWLHHYGSALPNVVNVIRLGIQRKTVKSGFQACILFDSGAEKHFVSIAFSPFIDIALATLDTSYEVELVDGK